MALWSAIITKYPYTPHQERPPPYITWQCIFQQETVTVCSTREPEFKRAESHGAQLSRCPVEDGVVYTSRWGTVSPGTVLAAIAAALEPQEVELALLLTEPTEANNDTDKLEKFERYKAMSLTVQLHNIWVATLAGKVSVDSLLAGPVTATRYGMEGPGIEARWGRNFPHRSWGPPSLLNNG